MTTSTIGTSELVTLDAWIIHLENDLDPISETETASVKNEIVTNTTSFNPPDVGQTASNRLKLTCVDGGGFADVRDFSTDKLQWDATAGEGAGLIFEVAVSLTDHFDMYDLQIEYQGTADDCDYNSGDDCGFERCIHWFSSVAATGGVMIDEIASQYFINNLLYVTDYTTAFTRLLAIISHATDTAPIIINNTIVVADGSDVAHEVCSIGSQKGTINQNLILSFFANSVEVESGGNTTADDNLMSQDRGSWSTLNNDIDANIATTFKIDLNQGRT